MNDQVLIEFDSHIAGKNARVRLYPDRIEWKQGGWMSGGSKKTLAVMTGGASLLVTGARGKKDENMILIRSIASVSNKKSGLTKTLVVVNTPAGGVEFRCSGSEAEKFKSLLLQQMSSGAQATQPTPMAAPSAAGHPILDQIQQLGELRAAGVLSDAEFDAKKSALLAKM